MDPSPALSAYLDDWVDAQAGDAPIEEELPIEDDVFADRMLYRLAKVLKDRDDNETFRRESIVELDNWCDRKKAKIEREASWIERGLEAFARNRVARGGPKALALPSGALKLTKPLESVDVRDPDAFRAWALANRPGLLRFPEPPAPEPDKASLKGLKTGESRPFGDLLEFSLVSEGEIVPGAFVVVPKEDRFKAVPERSS
jgi:hypothetical protein